MRLRTKTVLIATTLTLLGLALGFIITYWFLVELRLADVDEANALLAGIVLDAALSAPRYEVPATVNEYLVRETGVSAAQVYRDAQLLWQGGPYEAPQPLDPLGLTEPDSRTVGSWRVTSLRQDDLVVQVGRPVTSLRAILGPYASITITLTLALGLLSLLLAWLSARVALRPIESLSVAIAEFDETREVPVPQGNDEAAVLAHGFAALLEKLRLQRGRELRFMAYAAHELRTPVSALRASLEVARVREGQMDLAVLARLRREARRLEEFTQNLLALSRAEAHEVRLEPVDLGEVVEATYDRLQPLALERGKELAVRSQEVATRADPRLLEQALNNLVGNALRYSSGSGVEVANGVVEGRPYLEVIDEGPGIPEPLVEGLGLRVVRAVAEAHDGEVCFGQDGRSRVRLWLWSRAESPNGNVRLPVKGPEE